jgi:hypothetical protein
VPLVLERIKAIARRAEIGRNKQRFKIIETLFAVDFDPGKNGCHHSAEFGRAFSQAALEYRKNRH